MEKIKVPLFDLNYGSEEEEAVLNTVRSKWISSGERCMELEALFCKMWNVNYACAVSSCTAALHLAMLAVGVQPGDEVIVPALTFVATINAVCYAGGIPVLADICGPDNLNINPDEIEKLITPRTKAIVVMHYAGFPCEMDQILKLARSRGIKIIEDACHGPLSEYKGKKLGTLGDIGCFSFFSNKNISTGEGGMVLTDHKDYMDRLRLLRSHGMTTMSYERAKGHSTSYDVKALGYNYRLDDIRASLGIVQVKKLKDDLIKRKKVREIYEKQLADCPDLIVPFANYKGFVSNYIFPTVLRNGNAEYREVIRQELLKEGIQTSVHYPSVSRFSIYKNAVKGNLENTEYVADTEITLPMYGSLEAETVNMICTILKEKINEVKRQ